MVQIAVLGATGNVGRRIAAEAVARGHRLTAVARDVSGLSHDDRQPVAVDVSDADRLSAVVSGQDVVISALRWDNNDVRSVLDVLRASAVPRLIVVVGAGSLQMPDGRVYYEHLLDRGVDPPSSRAALAALKHLREEPDLAWTAVSPAADIFDGERTGVFRVGRDAMIVDDDGQSRISHEDFAVAILDEVENPQFPRARFSVAY
jgi:uncharacterized protein